MINLSYFLLALSLVVNQIFFVVISIFGLSYTGSEDSSLFSSVVLAINSLSIFIVIFKEATLKYKSIVSKLYYLIPVIILFLFILEGCSIGEQSGKVLRSFLGFSVAPLYVAIFVLRSKTLPLLLKQFDLIMVICTIALVLNIPSMVTEYGFTRIGGGGGHQQISYTAAFCFGINLCGIISHNSYDRYSIFRTKFFLWISYLLLALQVIITIIGGGKGGLVLLLVNVFFILIFVKRKSIKTIFQYALIIIPFLIIISSTLNNSFFDTFREGGIDRTLSIYSKGGIAAGDERFNIYDRVFQVVNDSPVIGHGLFRAYDELLGKTGIIYSHNLFLDALLQFGYIGFVFFFIFYIKAYSHIIWIAKNARKDMLLLPICLYPMTDLLFSNMYLTSSLFWFTLLTIVLHFRYMKSIILLR